MNEQEKKLYEDLLQAFMSASHYLNTHQKTSGQFRAVVIGCRRTGLAIDANIRKIEAAKAGEVEAAPKAKRTRKKKSDGGNI